MQQSTFADVGESQQRARLGDKSRRGQGHQELVLVWALASTSQGEGPGDGLGGGKGARIGP